MLKDKYRLDAAAFGDLYLQEHREWGENVCDEVGIKAVYPLWMQKGEAVQALEGFVNSEYKATVVRIREDKLPDTWLGRDLNRDFFNDSQTEDICPMGEAGEYHTFVYDGPLFSKKIEFSSGEIIQLETTKRLEIENLYLIDK